MADKKFDDVISEIPDYFYPAFAGEIVAVFGTNVLKPSEDGESPLFYISGTSGWNAALRMACKKLGLSDLWDWYDKLEWYDSDDFDGELVELLISKFIGNTDQSCNPYYKWLMNEKPLMKQTIAQRTMTHILTKLECWNANTSNN